MFNIRKILLPVVFTDPSTDTSLHLMQQAAWLARRFDAEIIMQHVVSPLSYTYGMLEPGHDVTARDLHAQVIQCAQRSLDRQLPPDFDGIAVTRVLLRGDPAGEIVEAPATVMST